MIKTQIHIEQVLRNKALNPNPFDLTEEEFEAAKLTAKDVVTDLHKVAGHNISLACTTVLIVYEALLEELLELNRKKKS